MKRPVFRPRDILIPSSAFSSYFCIFHNTIVFSKIISQLIRLNFLIHIISNVEAFGQDRLMSLK